jgi:hypothetical protein
MSRPNNLYSATILSVATISVLAIGFFSLTGAYSQSVPATNSERSSPPQPKDEPDVANQFTFHPGSLPPSNVEECAQYGKELVGKAIPDYNMCDLVVYRQDPAVTRSDGMIMNNFSGMGHYIELIPAGKVLNDTAAFEGEGNTSAAGAGNNDTTVVAFGEFSLIDPEVVPVTEVLQKNNWTITTIHNHMLDESPKLLFMHWTVTGNPDEIVDQAREAIMQTSTYANGTTTASEAGRGTPTSAGP